jgi:hypothetical protein
VSKADRFPEPSAVTRCSESGCERRNSAEGQVECVSGRFCGLGGGARARGFVFEFECACASTRLTMPLPTFTAQAAQANLNSPARAGQRLQHSPRRPTFTAQPAQANLYSTARAGGTAELITRGVVYVVHALQSSIPSSGGGSFCFRTRLGFRVTDPDPNPNPPESIVKVGRGVTLLASLSRASKERSGLHGAA